MTDKIKTISGEDLCECGHTRDIHTNIGCLDFEDDDDPNNTDPCSCSKFVMKNDLFGGLGV